MQRLDEGISANKSESPLLYTVCALGAKFYALDYSVNIRRLLPREILSAGNEWAKEAQRLIFSDLDVISIEKLMAAVLMHDHELRCGKFASAFMLCGISTRMAQALQMYANPWVEWLLETRGSYVDLRQTHVSRRSI